MSQFRRDVGSPAPHVVAARAHACGCREPRLPIQGGLETQGSFEAGGWTEPDHLDFTMP